MRKFNITFEHKSGNAQFTTAFECGPTWVSQANAITAHMNFLGLDLEGWCVTNLQPVS